MSHQHCTVAAQRIADARAAIRNLHGLHAPHDWRVDAAIYELDLIAHKVAEIELDHAAAHAAERTT